MYDVIAGIGRELWAAFERVDRIDIALVCYLVGGLMGFLTAREWYTSPFVGDEETPDDAGTSSTGQKETTMDIIPRADADGNHQKDSDSRAL